MNRLKASDPADRNMFARFGGNYRFAGRTQYQAAQAFSNTAGGATGNMRRGGQFRSMEGSRILYLIGFYSLFSFVFVLSSMYPLQILGLEFNTCDTLQFD